MMIKIFFASYWVKQNNSQVNLLRQFPQFNGDDLFVIFLHLTHCSPTDTKTPRTELFTNSPVANQIASLIMQVVNFIRIKTLHKQSFYGKETGFVFLINQSLCVSYSFKLLDTIKETCSALKKKIELKMLLFYQG